MNEKGVSSRQCYPWKLLEKHKNIILFDQTWVVVDKTKIRTFGDIWVPGRGQLKQYVLPSLSQQFVSQF